MLAARPPRQRRLSTVFCVAVIVLIVVTAIACGKRPLSARTSLPLSASWSEVLEMMWCLAASYSFSLTPITSVSTSPFPRGDYDTFSALCGEVGFLRGQRGRGSHDHVTWHFHAAWRGPFYRAQLAVAVDDDDIGLFERGYCSFRCHGVLELAVNGKCISCTFVDTSTTATQINRTCPASPGHRVPGKTIRPMRPNLLELNFYCHIFYFLISETDSLNRRRDCTRKTRSSIRTTKTAVFEYEGCG